MFIVTKMGLTLQSCPLAMLAAVAHDYDPARTITYPTCVFFFLGGDTTKFNKAKSPPLTAGANKQARVQSQDSH